MVAILVVLAIEIAAFAYYFWRTQRTFLLLSFVANGLAGASLVLALGAALGGLLAHLADVVLRLYLTRHAEGVPSTD